MNITPTITRHAAFVAAFVASLASSQAGYVSAKEHGISLSDFNKARAIWSQVKPALNCYYTGIKLADSKRSFNANDFYLTQDSEVIVTYIYDGAGARSSLGWYDAKTPNEKRIIWRDASSGPTAPLEVGSRASLGVLPADTNLRFFLQMDGARGGSQFLYQDAALNSKGTNQVAARVFGDDKSKPFVLGFEDRPNGGDQDFNDIIISIEIRPVAGGPTLYRVNPNTGKASLITQLSISGNYQTLLNDSNTGLVMMLADNGYRDIQINPSTGKVTTTNNYDMSGRKFQRMTYSKKRDRVYASDSLDNTIAEIKNKEDNATRTLLAMPIGVVPGDLVYDEKGDRLLVIGKGATTSLYAVTSLSGNGKIAKLFDIPSTISGMAWDEKNRLIGHDSTIGDIVAISTSNGEITKIGLSSVGGIDGDLSSSGQNPPAVVGTPSIPLYSAGADVVTQNDNVVPGQKGIKSNRSGTGVQYNINKLGLANVNNELFHELFYVPANATNLTFKVVDDKGSYNYHFGMYDQSLCAGIDPTSQEYRVRAIQSAVAIFDNRVNKIGNTVTLDAVKLGITNKVIGFFIVPNNTIKNYLAAPSKFTYKGNGNDTFRSPLFSVSAANPGKYDQCLAFGNSNSDSNVTMFSFEDLTRMKIKGDVGGDSDNSFDDLSFTVTPALQPAGSPTEMYLLKPAADDIRNRQTTADIIVDWSKIPSEFGKLTSIDLNKRTVLCDSYARVTCLKGGKKQNVTVSFSDPNRPFEDVVLFDNVINHGGKDEKPGNSIGLGHFTKGATLRFKVTMDGKSYWTDSSLNEKGTNITYAGLVPGTDTVIIKLFGKEDENITLAVTFEPWNLEYSGDVRNVLTKSDGNATRTRRNCY